MRAIMSTFHAVANIGFLDGSGAYSPFPFRGFRGSKGSTWPSDTKIQIDKKNIEHLV